MSSLVFQITGEVNVEVTITELADGSLKFDIQVLDDTGEIGDLRGLFFDLADDSLTSGISVAGADITDEVYKVDGVSSTGGSNNIKGEILNEYGKFDFGIEIGTQGISTDDIQFTSFTVSHDTVPLSISDFELQDIGIRLMSVGDPDGSRDGSLKLGGEIPEAEPEILAHDDFITVMESETAGDLEALDNGAQTILNNDTTDGLAYQGSVNAIDGDTTMVGQTVAGSNGGFATIYADGTIDFDAADEFDYLNDGENALTSFTYQVEGGDSATVTVNVLGEDDTPVDLPTINLAIMLSSAQSMYAISQTGGYGLAPYPDVNGDGQANQIMDMAYAMLNDFISDAFDVASAANYNLNLSLISFTENMVGEGSAYYTATDPTSFDTALATKIAADNSADLGSGFINANAWFDDVSNTGDTNAVFVISDGLSSGSWITEHADLVTNHGVTIDAYLPDISFGGPALSELNAVDSDGTADLVFTDDPVFAASLGYEAMQDALTLDPFVL